MNPQARVATAWAWLVMTVATAPAQGAATWTVVPGQSLAQAVQQAADGDTIELLAGVHRGQVAVLVQRRLTLRGAAGGPRAVLLADGQHAEGKGTLVVRGGEVQVDNIEFRGARVPDRNGAGIRFDGGLLKVRNCAFFDNQNGILTSNADTAELVVENSVFAHAPMATSLPHLVYVGRIARFTLQGSHLSGGQMGHLVKSRARVNDVRYNHIVDGAQGQAAYELEFPNGGSATVVGNVVAQSAHSSNPAIISFGAEGEAPGPGQMHRLLLVNNTVVNSGWRPAFFVRVHDQRLHSPVLQRWFNNLFVGLGVADVAWGDLIRGNFLQSAAALRQPEQGDYTLPPDSRLRGQGIAPEAVPNADGLNLRALWPRAEFTPPLGNRPLPALKTWSPGAHPVP